MSHPPIPPGCEHFYEREVHCLKDGKEWVEKQWFFLVSPCMDQPQYQKYVIEHEIGLDWKMPEPHRRQARTVIAAVAEVAWLKEAERLREEYVSAFTYNTRPVIVGDLEALRKAREDYALDSRIQGARDATANARAWREWGEQ